MPTSMLDAIRHATERGDFAHAGTLWEEWSRELAARLAGGRLEDGDWPRTVELYRWSTDVLLCARTQCQDRLNTLHAAGAYGAQQLLGERADVMALPRRAPYNARIPGGSSAPEAPR